MRFSFVLLFATVLLTGCSITSLEHLDIDAPIASDIHGANGYMEPKTHTLRATAEIHTQNEHNVDLGTITSDSLSFEATYDLSYPIVDLGAQWLFKTSTPLTLGAGLHINDGATAFFTLGINTAYVEAGADVGIWIVHRYYALRGTTRDLEIVLNDDDDEDDDDDSYESTVSKDGNDISPMLTLGGYLSFYIENFFFTYSINAYKPYFDVDGISVNLPYVAANYLTFGYRLNKHWEFNVGATCVYGDFEGDHWSAQTGVSYYFF